MKVVIREAVGSDKAPLMEFIRHVWGGHDYIPRVWDDWISDKKAVLLVVEVDGSPVGMNRMRFMPDGSGWLEGVRIHPDYRGRGLASMLGRASMEVGAKRGVNVYRLTSHARNWRAHRQVKKMGLAEVSRLSVYEPAPGARFRGQKGVREVAQDEVEEAFEEISTTREYRLGDGLYWDTFSAARLTHDLLAHEVRAGNVLARGTALAVVKAGGEGEGLWRQVCFVGGGVADSLCLIRHAFGKKETVKARWRIAYLPQGSKIISALREEGFRRAAPMVVFEGRIAKS